MANQLLLNEKEFTNEKNSNYDVYKTHYIFDMIEPAKEIIEQIKSIIPLSFQKTPTRTRTRSKSKSPRSKSPRSKSKSSTGGKKKIKTSKKYNKKIISRKIKKNYKV